MAWKYLQASCLVIQKQNIANNKKFLGFSGIFLLVKTRLYLKIFTQSTRSFAALSFQPFLINPGQAAVLRRLFVQWLRRLPVTQLYVQLVQAIQVETKWVQTRLAITKWVQVTRSTILQLSLPFLTWIKMKG